MKESTKRIVILKMFNSIRFKLFVFFLFFELSGILDVSLAVQ